MAWHEHKLISLLGLATMWRKVIGNVNVRTESETFWGEFWETEEEHTGQAPCHKSTSNNIHNIMDDKLLLNLGAKFQR